MPAFRLLEVILPIFLIALVGFIFGKYKKLSLKTLADFIIYVSAPALALALLSGQQISVKEVSTIALCAAFVILASGAISFFLFKAFKVKVPTGIYLPIMFMNSGFIGYPLAFFALGEFGFSRALIYDITNAILIFTLGIYLVSQGKDRWQIFKIPFIYAALLGIILSFTGTSIPPIIFAPLNLVGATTIPLALFLLGCRLATIKIKSWKLPLSAALLRILLGLGLGIMAAFIFKVGGIAGKIVILSSSLPAAVTTVAIAEEYEADSELVASTIALSTFISILTIPLVLNWLMR
jgi:predicted permease